MSQPTILYENEYCHVVNNDNGEIELIEGPIRYDLPPNKKLYSRKLQKLVLKETEYIILQNPFDPIEGRCILGEKRVIQGPLVRSLYPDERLQGGRHYSATVLNENQGAIIFAENDFDERRAGEKWLIKGPRSFVPHKYERLLQVLTAVQVSQNEAIYVRDTLTSELRLVTGPISFIPDVHEEIYEKSLSPDEYTSLSIDPPRASSRAFQIQVQKNEAVAVIDYHTRSERYVIGPAGYMLGPHEGVKVLDISGDVPKRESVRKLAVIRLGPDFMSDSFRVRTKDNAVLQLVISYKWRFIMDEDEQYKIFHGDFIGYSCQSMRSRVREEVSKHEFEHFHTNSSEVLRKRLFREYSLEVKRDGEECTDSFTGRFFSEFNFLIFQLDVKGITAVDPEIERLLNESIKSSMKIVVSKKKEQAEMEQKKNEIVNTVEIEKMREGLIRSENDNFRKLTVERARIEGQTVVEAARAEMMAQKLLETSRLELELANLQEKMGLLRGEAGDVYLEYVKAHSLGSQVSRLTVVPEGMSTLFIPRGSSGGAARMAAYEDE